jgi:hypothetical protein
MTSFKLSKPKKRNVVDRSGVPRTRLGGKISKSRTKGTYNTHVSTQKKRDGKGYSK